MNTEDLVFYIWKHSVNPNYYQPVMAIEEMSELTKELSKYVRGKDAVDKIAEEIADVELTLESLKFGFQISQSRIDRIKKEKIERYFERVEKGTYG